MAKQPSSTIVNQPFLGLWLTDPPWTIDPRAFTDCNNVMIQTGQVTSQNMGWLYQGIQLNGPVTLIADFPTANNHFMVLGTPTDLYNWHNGSPKFITPIYNTGTATGTGTAMVGVGTTWKTKMGTLAVRNFVEPGDQVYIGSMSQNDPAALWATVVSVNSDTSITLDRTFTSAANQPYTIRQLARGDNNVYHWDFEVFPDAGTPFNSDIIFITNGLDPIVAWDANDIVSQYLVDMPFLAFELRRYKNMMIYGGLTQNGQILPNSIANSDNGAPTDMANGVAGQYIVSDGPYTINWLGVLGNNLMIYMGDIDGGSVVAAQFVGLPTNFVFTEVIRGRGPIASRLVAEFPDRHEFIGSDGQYRYNGLFIQNMNTQLWRVVLQNFDRARANKSFCAFVLQYGIVHFALPLITDSETDIETAWVECYLEQANNPLLKPTTKRDFPFTAQGQNPKSASQRYWNESPYTFNVDPFRWSDNTDAGAYAVQFVGDSSGKIYKLFTVDSQDGAAYVSHVTFGHKITVNERSRGLVKRIYPFANQANGYSLTVTLTLYDQVSGNPWKVVVDTMPLDYSGNRFVSPFSRGRVMQVDFSTPGPNQPWVLNGYDYDIVPGGQR